MMDVLTATDLRLPGGTTGSVVEEVRAAAAAGYSCGLLHVPSRLVRGARPLAPAVAGLVRDGTAALVGADGRAVRARLVVLRHPTVFSAGAAALPPVTADRAVMVVNHAAVDADGSRNYDPDAVHAAVTAWLGVEPTWAPIGPVARQSLVDAGATVPVRDEDWLNILDLDSWLVPRTGPLGPRPVIGRHSRPQPAKWPDRREDLLGAYPDDPAVVVRVLGGAKPAEQLLGRVPAGWLVEPFGARPAREFLADVDFWVYFHAAATREAYGRAIMEALASGTVVVLPHHLREVFGDAALYRRPDEVLDAVRELHADVTRFLEQSRRGQAFMQRHSPAAHVARIAQLVGPPSEQRTDSTPVRRPAPPPTHGPGSGAARRVLFVTSNGAGMGHLTRLLAVARRMGDGVQPMFLSLSSAVPVVGGEGIPWEYCPSRGALGSSTKAWNAMFARRFAETLSTFRPDAVVFDGTWPYSGLIAARSRFPEVRFVWSRRAMWKADVPPTQLEKTVFFDAVVEPGEYAAPFDRGATTTVDDAVRVDPVVLLGTDELLDRDEARRRLGLDPERPTLLMTLGAGNINDIRSDVGAVVDTMASHPDWQVCLTRPPIAERGAHVPDSVRTVSVYPLARYSHAFDAAVAAAGYNSFHELLAYGVPTAFVPNLSTVTDDQAARSRYAAFRGAGLEVVDLAGSFRSAAEQLLDPGAREAMRTVMRTTYPGNGATAAADLLRDVLGLPARELAS